MAKAPLKYKNIAKLNAKLSELQRLTAENIAASNWDKALEYALQAHKMVPAHVVPLDRAGYICLQARRFEDAIQYANKALNRDPNYINSINILSTAYGELKNWEKVSEVGLKALQLTEASLGDLPLPKLPEISNEKKNKHLLSFSLFGDNPIYLEGACLNAQLVNQLYPNWVCRFYIDGSVPQNTVERLQSDGAEIVRMSDDETMPKTFWRFLAADDENVDYIAFRDADSVISPQEARLVQQWQESGKRFHTIRDGATHTELILAGLWGMRAQSVPNMRSLIDGFVAAGQLHHRYADQHFLRHVIWQYAKQDLCAHDSLFGFGEGVISFDNPYRDQFHIGCRECSHGFEGTNEKWQEGDCIEWVMYSQYSAEQNEDGTPLSIGEEREICRYRQIVKDGKISAKIPKRYARGMDEGLTRIELHRVI